MSHKRLLVLVSNSKVEKLFCGAFSFKLTFLYKKHLLSYEYASFWFLLGNKLILNEMVTLNSLIKMLVSILKICIVKNSYHNLVYILAGSIMQLECGTLSRNLRWLQSITDFFLECGFCIQYFTDKLSDILSSRACWRREIFGRLWAGVMQSWHVV